MIEFATIRVHYGYCPKCAEPVKLQRMHPISGEHYWKIVWHFGCSENGKEGKVNIGAREAFFKKYCLINKMTGLAKRHEKKTGKPRNKILPDEGGYQFDLFRTPVAL